MDFIIALPFLSYISKKNPTMSQLMAYLCDCINDTGYQKSESIHRIFIRVVMINNESTYETVADVPES